MYTIQLEAELFQYTTIASDAADGPYRDQIYAELTTLINLSGLFSVVNTNLGIREIGGATFVTSIEIGHNVANVPFSFDARASHGLELLVESFTL